MKKYKMKLNRKYRLATTLGHIIQFYKDEVVEVPEAIVRLAVDIGAEFVKSEEKDEVFKEPEAPSQPITPGDRHDAIRVAVDAIMAANEREDFTATGNPKMKAVEDKAGFKIDKGELAAVLKARNEDQ